MAEDSKQEPKLKVTDRRMFTADGELREGYRHLDNAAAEPKVAEPAHESAEAADRPAARPAQPEAPPEGGSETRSGGRVEIPTGAPAGLGAPSFLDLVGALTEPIAIYLGDAKLPDGSSAENLEAARFYIDLLDVLRTKTAGNLTPQEASVLEDLLYQLRMRYVRKRD